MPIRRKRKRTTRKITPTQRRNMAKGQVIRAFNYLETIHDLDNNVITNSEGLQLKEAMNNLFTIIDLWPQESMKLKTREEQNEEPT